MLRAITEALDTCTVRHDIKFFKVSSNSGEYTFSIYYIAKTGGKYGIINLSNEQVKDFNYVNMNYVEKGDFIQADVSE